MAKQDKMIEAQKEQSAEKVRYAKEIVEKIQYGYYAFYPAHITILVIISKIISAINGY